MAEEAASDDAADCAFWAPPSVNDDASSALYVYKGVMSARAVLAKVELLAARR